MSAVVPFEDQSGKRHIGVPCKNCMRFQTTHKQTEHRDICINYTPLFDSQVSQFNYMVKTIGSIRKIPFGTFYSVRRWFEEKYGEIEAM